MKFQEIGNLVKQGVMQLDVQGHILYEEPRKRFVEQFDRLVASANGSRDGKWDLRDGETMEKQNLRMRRHYQMKLDAEIEDGQEIDTFVYDRDNHNCFGCGERLAWVKEPNQLLLTLRNYYDYDGKDIVNHPLGYTCPYATPRAAKGEIKLQSDLVFANYFYDPNTKEFAFPDCPTEEEHNNKWSLNSLRGVENRLHYKCQTHNVAYGQMTNTSVSIYLHPDKKSILVGTAYLADSLFEELCNKMPVEEADKEFEKLTDTDLLLGHKLVGKPICLDVWRWEAADRNTLGKVNYDWLKKEKRDRVELKDIPHGTWQFEHYYNFDAQTPRGFDHDECTLGGHKYVYSRFTLKEET